MPCFFTTWLWLLLLLLTSGGVESNVFIDASLGLNLMGSFPPCPGGRVENSGGTVQVHYREWPNGTDWTFLDNVTTSTVEFLPLIMNPVGEGIQFRLLQAEEDLEDGCNCWGVINFSVTSMVEALTRDLARIQSNISDAECCSNGLVDETTFCNGNSRGFITEVISYERDAMLTIDCSGNVFSAGDCTSQQM